MQLAEKKYQRPVLMVPLRRCGSHAIRLRLNLSRDFYAPYPLHIVDFMPLVPHYGDLENDDHYFRMIVDVVNLQAINMVKWDIPFDPNEVFEVIKNEPRSVHRIVWELLFKVGRHNHARVVMDKSLDNIHYANELMKLFDDMLFLNVVRDPRAQVSSMTRAIIHDFDPLLNALMWVQAHTLAHRLTEKHPERTLTIRYEDFINNQEKILRRICTFLSIDFSPDMLDASCLEEGRKIAAMSALWESNASPPIKANMDKFKQQLDMEAIERIETVGGELMDFYGYERITPGDAAITPEIIDQARERSNTEKKKAWETLRHNDRRDWELRQLRNDFLAMTKTRVLRDFGS
uniref:Sulfotransferase family protein n=1 Tax=Candidatus Kentrum sp. FW TaxID=2126338 RepID=A0A450TPH0_9GAMM|nr:MAG: Sulfotransferase family protein [Candidatus Kentron sp. FW]